jgi:hypothetical protein
MIADMNDRTPIGDQQDATVDGDRTDGTRQDATAAPTVTVPEAARILKVSTDAVRSRLRRGTLGGVKVAGEWHVPLAALHDTRQDTQPSPTGLRQDTDRITTVVDVAPLAELIDNLTRRNTDLSATAAMWQTRAAHLEDQLKQLTAGETPPTTSAEAPESPRSDDQPLQGLRTWWRRLWGS